MKPSNCSIIISCLFGLLLMNACNAESESIQENFKLRIVKVNELKKELDESQGHLVVLNYWATWCKSCLKELKKLSQLQVKYNNQGLRVISVSIDDHENKSKFGLVEKIYKDSGYLYSATISKNKNPKEIMGIVDEEWLEIIPVTYLIARNGKVIKRYLGSRSFSNLEGHLKNQFEN